MRCDYHPYMPKPATWAFAAGRLNEMEVKSRVLCDACMRYIVQVGTFGDPLPETGPGFAGWYFDEYGLAPL